MQHCTTIGIDLGDKKHAVVGLDMVINFILDPPRSHWISARP